MAQLIELKLQKKSKGKPEIGLWQWTVRCPCGQIIKGEFIGNEEECKRYAEMATCCNAHYVFPKFKIYDGSIGKHNKSGKHKRR